MSNSSIKARRAFSVLETMVVLLIMGMLASSVFVGVNMLADHKIHKIVSNIHAYRSGLHTFNTSYGAFPGMLSSRSGHARAYFSDASLSRCPNSIDDKVFCSYIDVNSDLSAASKCSNDDGVELHHAFLANCHLAITDTMPSFLNAELHTEVKAFNNIDSWAGIRLTDRTVMSFGRFIGQFLNSNYIVIGGMGDVANGVTKHHFPMNIGVSDLSIIELYHIKNKIDPGNGYKSKVRIIFPDSTNTNKDSLFYYGHAISDSNIVPSSSVCALQESYGKHYNCFADIDSVVTSKAHMRVNMAASLLIRIGD